MYKQVNKMMSSSWIHIHMSFIADDVIKCGGQIHGENSARFLRMERCRFITLVVNRTFGGWRVFYMGEVITLPNSNHIVTLTLYCAYSASVQPYQHYNIALG
jgi:hypothetical protein